MDFKYQAVRLAEWSKAPRSGRGLFGGVGSNPTADILRFIAAALYYFTSLFDTLLCVEPVIETKHTLLVLLFISI